LKDWSKILLKTSDSLEKAIKVLHVGGLQIALVVDNKGKLLGTITDGDIRRALIKYRGMDYLVEKVMNNSPITALSSESSDVLMSRMKSRNLLHIPIIDEKGFLVGLETLQHLTYNKKYDNPVFLMAGGFGTRLHPLTEDTPKPLLNVGNRPILETILSRFIRSGFHNFFISTHFKAEKIQAHFGDGSAWGVKIEYVNEEKPLGTAGSIGLLPKNLPKLPILMMNGDVLTKVNFEHLLAFHQEQKGIATMCIRDYDVQIPFGVVNVEEQQAKSIVEKPIEKYFVNAGIYVLEPELVNKVKPNTHIDMPNLLEKQIKEGKSVSIFPIHEYWLDIGHMKEYESAHDSFSNGFTLDD
jgi:dTDP-glucose pyrophosphorylase/predicted transcriptional regulator